MEFEQLHHSINPGSTQSIHEFSLESVFSLQTEDSIVLSAIQDDALYDDCMERLLEIETELMDFSSMTQDNVICLESSDDVLFELGHGMIQETTGDVSLWKEENSLLKGIHEELLEDSSLTDLLLMGAEAVEAQNWTLSSNIIAKLRNLLLDGENGGSSFNRLALFFTQGLHYKSITAPEMLLPRPGYRQQYNMSSFQVLQELSPCVKFAHFTANQAILESTQGDQEIHIIDFDIMEGIQWPPLMVDLTMRKDVSFKVTAIIADQQDVAAVQQTGRRLKEYADSINLPFVFKQMMMLNEEDFESIEVGQALVVNCMIHQLHMPNRSFSSIKTFLGGVSRLSPKLVVLVEEELFSFYKFPYMSYVEFFCEAIHHYTTLSDSLVSSFLSANEMELRLIEKEYLGVKIVDSVSQFPCKKKERLLWEEGFASLKGFKPVPLSSCNVSQANFLVSLFSGRFWVQHEKCRLSLCWKSRPLTTASIWVPKSEK
jgi:hypothetical protein